MRLGSPGYLWLVGPTATVLIALYILKLRRRDVPVASTLLWREAIRDVQANAPFQKLRRSLLLLLQLLAAAAATGALVRPYLPGSGADKMTVIVLDVSASMQATDVQPSRFEKARGIARELVSHTQPGDQVMIITAASHAVAATPFTDETATLYRALSTVTPTEETGDMRAALSFAGALVSAHRGSQIELISDGAWPPMLDLALGNTRLVYHPTGGSGHNLGIVAVDYRHNPGPLSGGQLFCELQNFDTAARGCTLTLHNGAHLLDAQAVALNGGGRASSLFALPEINSPLLLGLDVDVPDDFPTDNHADVVVQPRDSVGVTLVSRGNPSLLAALTSDPTLSVSTVSTASAAPDRSDEVVVYDRDCPRQLPRANCLLVQCSPSVAPLVKASTPSAGSVIDAEYAHPIFRFVDLTSLAFSKMTSGSAEPWAASLATSENGTVAAVTQQQGHRVLWLGFGLDADNSRFPLTVSYPIFVSNSVRWLAHRDVDAAGHVATGAPIVVGTPPEVRSVTLTRPNGTTEQYPTVDGQSFTYSNTTKAGIYAVSAPGFSYKMPANLESSTESAIQPQPHPELASVGSSAQKVRAYAGFQLRNLMAIIALALLSLEWYVFHRRFAS